MGTLLGYPIRVLYQGTLIMAGLKAGLINNINNRDFGNFEILDFGKFWIFEKMNKMKKDNNNNSYYY